MKLSVIIPAYNEEDNIPELVKRIEKVLSDYEKEIIFVDDGSKDNSFKVACELGIKVIRHPYNIGNGAAVKTGIRVAVSDFIVLLDADLQHPPEEMLSLIKEAESYDMIVGSRTTYSSGGRSIANRFFNALASYVTGREILDLTSGFRVIKTGICKKFLYLLPNRFSYPTTLTLAFLKSGRSVKFVPVKVGKRVKGRSKIHPFKDGVKFMLIIAKIATIYSPFKVFLPVSISFFLTGLVYYLYTFVTMHRFTNMSLLLITTAVIIFMLSLIAEQIAQLHIRESE